MDNLLVNFDLIPTTTPKEHAWSCRHRLGLSLRSYNARCAVFVRTQRAINTAAAAIPASGATCRLFVNASSSQRQAARISSGRAPESIDLGAFHRTFYLPILLARIDTISPNKIFCFWCSTHPTTRSTSNTSCTTKALYPITLKARPTFHRNSVTSQ
jgi:hypothetical protein